MTSLPAILTAAAGLVTAVATLVTVIRHINGPAHQSSPRPVPPESKNPN